MLLVRGEILPRVRWGAGGIAVPLAVSHRPTELECVVPGAASQVRRVGPAPKRKGAGGRSISAGSVHSCRRTSPRHGTASM